MTESSKKRINIVTSLCVDVQDETLNYQLFYLNNKQKRLTYWKCCMTFFSTSVRCNPEALHILYTNDETPIKYNGIDLKKFLEEIGIEIRYLPFKIFTPPKEFSRYLMLAYYKFDVLNDLCNREENTYSIILDSDCIWTKKDKELTQLIKSDKLLIFDVYDRKDPKDKGPHNFSRHDMGRLFKYIDSKYPKKYPIWFGGEIIAGSAKNLKIISNELHSVYNHILQIAQDPAQMIYSKKMLERGMEFLASYVINKEKVQWHEAKKYIKRIWTSKKINNVSPEDINLTIWHMISEKIMGIPALCEEVLNRNSTFWQMPLENFNIYLGEYLGVPERKHRIKKPGFFKVLLPKMRSKIKEYSFKLN